MLSTHLLRKRPRQLHGLGRFLRFLGVAWCRWVGPPGESEVSPPPLTAGAPAGPLHGQLLRQQAAGHRGQAAADPAGPSREPAGLGGRHVAGPARQGGPHRQLGTLRFSAASAGEHVSTTHPPVCACMRALHGHVYTHVQLQVHTCACVYMHPHTCGVCVCMHVYVCMCVCTRACLLLCMCTYNTPAHMQFWVGTRQGTPAMPSPPQPTAPLCLSCGPHGQMPSVSLSLGCWPLSAITVTVLSTSS